jgi:hypothetical protein
MRREDDDGTLLELEARFDAAMAVWSRDNDDITDKAINDITAEITALVPATLKGASVRTKAAMWETLSHEMRQYYLCGCELSDEAWADMDWVAMAQFKALRDIQRGSAIETRGQSEATEELDHGFLAAADLESDLTNLGHLMESITDQVSDLDCYSYEDGSRNVPLDRVAGLVMIARDLTNKAVVAINKVTSATARAHSNLHRQSKDVVKAA